MIKVNFICHGNICRSPMAKYIFKDMIEKRGVAGDFIVDSCATSYEEIGNGIYPPAKEKLKEHHIYFDNKKTATILEKEDYDKYDYIIGMEDRNIVNIERILGKHNPDKIKRLLDYSNNPRDISDPWYSNNFDKAYEDILEGCTFFLDFLIENNIV